MVARWNIDVAKVSFLTPSCDLTTRNSANLVISVKYHFSRPICGWACALRRRRHFYKRGVGMMQKCLSVISLCSLDENSFFFWRTENHLQKQPKTKKVAKLIRLG